MSDVPPVRMPAPESRFEEFHLLEDLFKPRACLSGSRIVVWVYSDGSGIREVVLSGHAEGRTCASATSILIEQAKRLGDGVQWMLTCGGAYFRVSEEQSREVAPQGFDDDPILMEMLRRVPGGAGVQRPNAVLGEMIQALQLLADQTGLVEITHHDWQSLVAFRNAFQSRIGTSSPEIILPKANHHFEIADFLPIIPGNRPDGEPLIFNLEGWDFDCPGFQLVADRHLRKVQRELLSDALRRRGIYRDWLRSWTDQWVRGLSKLPESQGKTATLNVPQEDAMQFSKPVTAPDFLNNHAASFLDRGQFWHKELAYLRSKWPYDQWSDAELDKKVRPEMITEIDFERGRTNERSATESDTFTWRERLLVHDPRMISHCLVYVRRMDWIIKPYEELRMKKVGSRSRQGKDEVEIVDEISRRIVIETMIRGWPSVYLQDKRDSAEFERWADDYRSHIWEIIAEQAETRGVALDILMEKNVVYDVRFNDDLGCTIQPLMLVDDKTHAQLHASRAGASVVVPLWSRLQSETMPDYVLKLGPNNRKRARQLVMEAKKQASGEHADSNLCAGSLRLAMACHPAEAGKLILEEWFNRLGCDTSQEFHRARIIINAAELLSRERYKEAQKYVAEYLAQEPTPVPDAFVMSAIIESIYDEDQRKEIRKAYVEYKRLVPRHEELASKLRQSINPELLNRMDAVSLLLQKQTFSFEETERLARIQRELDRLGERIKTLETELEKGTDRRRKLIEQALHNPADVRRTHPAMALAAEKASETLQLTLKTDGLYRWSDAMVHRYGDIRRIVEARGLLDILHAVSMIAYQIDQNPNEARLQALKEMEELSSALWLPIEIESDLRNLAEEFGKGEWDRLQTLQITGVIRDANSTCFSRMQDLLSGGIVSTAPLKEAIATRIHITQTIAAKFKNALDMLLTATMPLGGAIKGRWVIKDSQVTDLPEGGQLKFEKSRRIVSLVTKEGKTPLLQATQISDEEAAFLAETVSDPTLPDRLNRFAPSLAEALLATQIVPCPEWQVWRDAMSILSRELLIVLSNFRYEANLMPEHSPPLPSDADFERRMDRMTPRTTPKIDWDWRDLDTWGQFTGNSCRRTRAS